MSSPPHKLLSIQRNLASEHKRNRECLLADWHSLAWAELYMMMASIITKVKLELYETTSEDVDIYSDMLIAEPKRYVNGVRFKVV